MVKWPDMGTGGTTHLPAGKKEASTTKLLLMLVCPGLHRFKPGKTPQELSISVSGTVLVLVKLFLLCLLHHIIKVKCISKSAKLLLHLHSLPYAFLSNKIYWVLLWSQGPPFRIIYPPTYEILGVSFLTLRCRYSPRKLLYLLMLEQYVFVSVASSIFVKLPIPS